MIVQFQNCICHKSVNLQGPSFVLSFWIIFHSIYRLICWLQGNNLNWYLFGGLDIFLEPKYDKYPAGSLVQFYMYQLIPAVNISPRRPRGFAHLFAQPPRFYQQICAWGTRLRRGQIFQKWVKIYWIFLFSGDVQEAIQNGRKTLVFVYANCIYLQEYLY